jgi:general secretion pathway protein K
MFPDFALKQRSGVALLLTLLIVALAAASVISFIRLTQLEAKIADNQYSYAQAEILAQAGLKGAMTMLAMDDPDVDSFSDAWSSFEQYAGLAAGLFEEGAFTGRIVDLSSRFDINTLVDRNDLPDTERVEQLERLLAAYELPPELVPPIIDWLDGNETTEPGGAENEYYESLEKPYPCGNGRLRTLGQLSLIKDLTPEIIYGTRDKPGIQESLTVFSKDNQGLINLNTAGEKVLMCLDADLTQSTVQEIIGRRATEPFEKIEEVLDYVSLDPNLWNRIAKTLTVSSSHFLIGIEGNFREARVVITAVVERDSQGVRLLFYREG